MAAVRDSGGLGLAADIALTAGAVASSVAGAGLPPTTDQLDDAQRIGQSSYENSIEEAGREQGTGTSQN